MKLDIYPDRLPDVKPGELIIRPLKDGQEAQLAEIQNRALTGTWGFTPNTL